MSQIFSYPTGSMAPDIKLIVPDVGASVGPDILGVINIIGGDNITTDGLVGPNTLEISVNGTTNHAVQIGNFLGSLDSLPVGMDGQVLVAATNANPAFATLTSSGGTIVFTPGANTLNLEASAEVSEYTYTPVNASPYVAATTELFISVDSSGAPITVQLPNAATAGKSFVIKDRTGSAAINAITVTTVGGAVLIDGAATFILNTAYQSISVMGSGSAYEIY